MGLSALFYLVLLFSPLAFLQTANAASDQDPLQESYGVGEFQLQNAAPHKLHRTITDNCLEQLSVSISAPPTLVSV